MSTDAVSKFVAWITGLAGAFLTIWKFFAVKAAVSTAVASHVAGAVADPNILQQILDALQVGGGGLGAVLISFFIPAAVRFVSSKVGGKIKPGFVAAIDRTACETLLQTRHDKPEDVAHVTALIESGVKLEVAARLAAAKVA